MCIMRRRNKISQKIVSQLARQHAAAGSRDASPGRSDPNLEPVPAAPFYIVPFLLFMDGYAQQLQLLPFRGLQE